MQAGSYRLFFKLFKVNLRGISYPASWWDFWWDFLFTKTPDNLLTIRDFRAGNGGRTRDPQLGKLMLYH